MNRKAIWNKRSEKALEEIPCMVHGFFQDSYVVGASPLRGGHSAGQMSSPVAVIELADGSIEVINPTMLKMEV